MNTVDYTMNEYDYVDEPAESSVLMNTDLIPSQARKNEYLIAESKRMMNIAIECKDLMMTYACAMKEVRTRFEILNAEYGVRCSRNPIHSISTRLKGSASIVEKLNRKNLALSAENIQKYIHDVAGVRVICYYVDDVFSLAKAICKQNGIRLIKAKDYITTPKPNGYRSLHLILSVPVSFADNTQDVSVEVQIRTIAMDSWASMEHQLKYKSVAATDEHIVSRLRDCAEAIAQTDQEMVAIRNEIESATEQTADDILIDKIKKMDHPLE